MHHHKLENELKHLEMVLPHVGRGPFPPSYWQDRIAALPQVDTNRTYRSRVERLKDILSRIETTTRTRPTSASTASRVNCMPARSCY
ncbi:hypothetical protein B0G82_7958 [Paraburkholderia sp. BL17N1]|nr:hypothetical protein B0G82_7958 [Paraburkholderia sp. BL17N1]